MTYNWTTYIIIHVHSVCTDICDILTSAYLMESTVKGTTPTVRNDDLATSVTMSVTKQLVKFKMESSTNIKSHTLK